MTAGTARLRRSSAKPSSGYNGRRRPTRPHLRRRGEEGQLRGCPRDVAFRYSKESQTMRTRTCLWVTLGFLLATATVSGVAQTRAESMTIDDIQNTLLRLPYYGVFDFLAFNYEKGTVTLTGY